MGESHDRADGDWSDLTALDVYGSSASAVNDASCLPLFTASNPHGSVSVTVFLSGQIFRVELSSKLSMTEAELGAEVTMVATLAQMQARAGQHVIIALAMRQLGHDPALTTSLLERKFGLPSPKTLAAERGRILADCFVGEQ